MEVVVVAGILDIHQVAGDVFHAHLPPFLHGNDQLGVIFGRAQTIDAGYRSHDDHVLAGQQGVGGGVAQFVDIVVDGRVFFDIGIGRGDVGFRLIIIIITDEIFHGVVRKQSPEFAVQLGGQSFIVGQHQGGTSGAGDDVGHGEGFTRTGDAEQYLIAHARLHVGDQFVDGVGLIPGGSEGRMKNKRAVFQGIHQGVSLFKWVARAKRRSVRRKSESAYGIGRGGPGGRRRPGRGRYGA